MRVGGRGREAEGDEKLIPVSLHKPAELPVIITSWRMKTKQLCSG